ncbi:hypothetical protein [Draconibacterium sp.]|uniref:hypothetical protein n=1 Tax=Draconibacterium sp. TaxID=1965318 RepID=UPI003566B156
MKAQRIIKTIIILAFVFNITQANAQQKTAYRMPASEKAVPKVVLEGFKSQHPLVQVKGWYVTHLVYWENDYSSDWYTGWYPQRTLVVYTYEKPNYYEVEFEVYPGELSRAIYNKYGYWYETRTQLRGMPMPVYDALQTSKYSNWKISVLKEKIESPAWPLPIYRFNVTKGMRSHILRMDEKGSIVQAKYLSE